MKDPNNEGESIEGGKPHEATPDEPPHLDLRAQATKRIALKAALQILQEGGVLAVNHASISEKTGISRSTLYRHWPKLPMLRNAAFLEAATSPSFPPRTNGPLSKDLTWVAGNLMMALNETPWGKIAPQAIALATNDAEVQALINQFQQDRRNSVRKVFEAAKKRGELRKDAPIDQLIEMLIAVPYYRKYIAGLPLDHEWLDRHVKEICNLALKN